MNRSPGFMFYPKDWWDFKVRRMSVAARGAYWDVLTIMWKDSKDQCSVLDNNDLLARAIGITVEQWLQLRLEIQQDSDQILEEKNGFLVSARLKKAAAEQRKYRKEQSRKGKISAQKRLNHGSTAVEPDTQPEGKSSSSSSSSEKEKNKNVYAPSALKLAALDDGEWLDTLKKDQLYTGLDIQLQFQKASIWCRGKKRKLTRKFFQCTWLVKALGDKPMVVGRVNNGVVL